MSHNKKRRRGASVLELSIVLVIFLMLTFGLLDLGLCVFRYNVLNNAARQGARRAIVHGALASVEGVWAHSIIVLNVQAAEGNGIPIVDGANDGLVNMLVLCNLSQTTINVTYSDTNQTAGSNVTVKLTTKYTPFMWFLGGTHTVTASSTMQVTH